MAEKDVCTANVQNVESAFEQVKGRGDTAHWEQFMQTLIRETQSMSPDQRRDFIESLNACNDARRAENPNLPKLHILTGDSRALHTNAV
jgi:hypothetical protein